MTPTSRGAVGITIRTDHEALVFLRSCRYANTRLRRWALVIQDYDLTLEHIPGKRKVVADYLSRNIDDEPLVQRKEEILVASIIENKGRQTLRNLFKNLTNLQENDVPCNSIILLLEALNPSHEPRYHIIDHISCKKDSSGFYKIILSEAITKTLVLEVHEAYAHIGMRKVQKMIEKDFYVFRLRTLLSEILSTCDTCQRSKYSTIKLQPMIQPILTYCPGELLSIDFYGPLRICTSGSKYLLTTIDVFSKFVAIYPIKKANTATVIRKLLQD